jgi:general stress protein 26
VTRKIQALIDGFEAAMLVTHGPEGHLRARPWAIAGADDQGDLWFATRVASAKVDEIEVDAEVGVTMQEGERFLSLAGTAEVVVDREALDRLWDEAWRAWFPGGKEGESLALIHVHPREGEYWEAIGGEKVRLHFEPGKPMERRDPAGEEKGEPPGTA